MINSRCHFLILFIQLVSIINFCHYLMPIRGEDNITSALKVDVGIIFDLETDVGKVIHTCILLAIEDYHATASRTATRIVPHLRDSEKDDVEAASAAIYLLKDVQVQAIFGPQTSTQTDFVINLGNRVKVPIISPATSPSLSVKENPFFIRGALPSSSQTKAIAAIVKNYDWRKVVIIHEDSSCGTGIVSHLTDALLEINTLVSYRSVISPSANDDQILKELYKLNTKQTRVFIVHLQPYLASRLFLKAKEARMMSSGYAWIITDVLTGLLYQVDPSVIESSMQGVLGIKPYVPRSNKLNNFTKRWRKRFLQEYPDVHQVELYVFGLWAYDCITSLAEAVAEVGINAIPKFKKAGERVTSNLTRFVLIVWVFVVLVLTSSYTASLSSMLTVQQLQPTDDLIKNGGYVGYQKGSFVKDFLMRMNFDSSKLRSYGTLEEYNDALSRGSKNGGVAAIVDELPYLTLFLNRYCRKYIMVGPTYKTAGFGFVFPKDSPLVPDVSRAVSMVKERGEFRKNRIQIYSSNETDCSQNNGTFDSLTLDSFKGLFLIAGVSAGSALLIFFLIFLYQNREILATDDSIWKKLSAIAKVFHEEKDYSNSKSEKPEANEESQTATVLFAASEASPETLPDLPMQSLEIRISDALGTSPADEEFSTTERATPVHETITETF